MHSRRFYEILGRRYFSVHWLQTEFRFNLWNFKFWIIRVSTSIHVSIDAIRIDLVLLIRRLDHGNERCTTTKTESRLLKFPAASVFSVASFVHRRIDPLNLCRPIQTKLKILFLGRLQFWIFDAIHFNFGNLRVPGFGGAGISGSGGPGSLAGAGSWGLAALAVSTAASHSLGLRLLAGHAPWRDLLVTADQLRGQHELPHAFDQESFERQRWCHR